VLAYQLERGVLFLGEERAAEHILHMTLKRPGASSSRRSGSEVRRAFVSSANRPTCPFCGMSSALLRRSTCKGGLQPFR
jgi:hypothetical protein